MPSSRVLLATYSASTILGGGVQVQVRALHKHLRRLGVESELFDPWHAYELKGYRVCHIFAAHVGTYHLAQSMANLGARLVVTPVFFSRRSRRQLAALAGFGALVRRFGGIWTQHTFCSELCRLAWRVLPNTRAESDLLADGLGVDRRKLGLLPNGVDECFADADASTFVRRYGARDFLLYVGHIGWGRKNLLPLLQVVRSMKVRLVLIGEVLDNTYARRCMSIVQDCPAMLHIPPQDHGSRMLASAYAACDTFVLPSFYETPGLAALEAGLAGAKLCITKYGGTVEYFGENAVYLDPVSRHSIRRSLERSLNAKKGTALRDRIGTNYLWGEVAKAAVREYGL